MTVRLLASAAVLAIALLAWRLDSGVPGSATTDTTVTTTGDPLMPVTAPPVADDELPPADTTDWGVVTPPDVSTPAGTAQTLNSEAISSLRRTRQGDPRAPRIGKDHRLRDAASDELRDNYGDYRAWQQQQRLAGYARYVAAANEKLAEMDAHLRWGESNGVSQADLAAGREKRQRLADARDTLLHDYPTLAVPDTDTLTPVSHDPAQGAESERQD